MSVRCNLLTAPPEALSEVWEAVAVAMFCPLLELNVWGTSTGSPDLKPGGSTLGPRGTNVGRYMCRSDALRALWELSLVSGGVTVLS